MEVDGMLNPKDEAVIVEVSRDRMLGVVSFEPEEDGGKRLSDEGVRSAIAAKGVVAGIDEGTMETIFKTRQPGHKYIIAKGESAVDGIDGRVELKFDAKALKDFRPREREDGTVDFRDLNAISNVTKGQVLAVKIAATPGKDGFNVVGQPVRAKKGKEARMPKGKNTVVLSDGITLVAGIDGKLEYDDHNVYINSVYTLNGDLDNGIGNIDFIGSVVINGAVNSGFVIKAGGSVEIKGSVEDVVIIAGGNVILSYGIQGTERSKITASGNVVAKYLQNVEVEAGGDIITEAILHSNVNAGDTIRVEDGKGTIVGGNVSATNMIKAKSIGSPMGTVTSIQIGVSPLVYREHKLLGEELKSKAEDLNKIDQSIKFLLEKKVAGQLDPQKQIMLERLNQSRGPIAEEYGDIRSKYNKTSAKLNEVKEGIIKASDTIYPGVKVSLGNLVKYIDDRCVNSVIRKIDGEIHIGI